MAKVEFDPASLRTVMRMLARKKNFDHDSPEMNEALNKIGLMVQESARRNLTNASPAGAVDTGWLRVNTSYRIERLYDTYSRVVVGAFGVRYARMVEYGGAFTDRQRRAMFAKFREKGLKPRPGKGIIEGGRYKARPFLGPALAQNAGKIQQVIRSLTFLDPKGED